MHTFGGSAFSVYKYYSLNISSFICMYLWHKFKEYKGSETMKISPITVIFKLAYSCVLHEVMQKCPLSLLPVFMPIPCSSLCTRASILMKIGNKMCHCSAWIPQCLPAILFVMDVHGLTLPTCLMSASSTSILLITLASGSSANILRRFPSQDLGSCYSFCLENFPPDPIWPVSLCR